MTSDEAYVPPFPSVMARRQDEPEALGLLVAQRKLYSIAKRFLNARLVGMFLIAIVAPIVGFVWPNVSVVCGAVAGAWIFLGRTLLSRQQQIRIDRAAAVQERFDSHVFGMSVSGNRENEPSLEDIAKLSGNSQEVRREAQLEKLRKWYPFESAARPVTAVAIAQRANVSYSDSLLRTTAKIWRCAIAGWGSVAIAVSFSIGLSLETFLLVVLLPLLPAFLDLVDFSRGYDTASHTRRGTATAIEDSINSGSVEASDLLVWQERIYELRRTTPLVPDAIYWFSRKSNEAAMEAVAGSLAATQEDGSSPCR